MHLRYDLQNKLELSNFVKQATFFLNKENCDFSFYLKDFATHISISKNIDDINQYNIEVKISELSKDQTKISQGATLYNAIHPQLDLRFKDLSFVQEIFINGGDTGLVSKKSVQESVQFMIDFVKFLSRLNKLSIVF